jgi:uncharacterized protein (DUF983 family)
MLHEETKPMPHTTPPARPIAPVVWQASRTESLASLPPMHVAIGRGLMGRCPNCGKTHLFRGYLSVVPECAACGAPLGLARADDAPPYFTILIVGHLILGGMLALEKAASPPAWVHAVIWLPLTAILSLALLRPIKGATVGLMLKLRMLKTDTDE